MGFPAGYTEVLLPKLLINTLSLLTLLRALISTLLSAVGLSHFLEPDFPARAEPGPAHHQPSASASLSATLIRDMLPAARYAEVVGPGPGHPETTCAVCLYEFEGDDEIRRLRNCTHMFHRSCVDRWIDHDRKTCPLCRTCLVPEELQEAFNQSLWNASGIPEFYSEYAPITNF